MFFNKDDAEQIIQIIYEDHFNFGKSETLDEIDKLKIDEIIVEIVDVGENIDDKQLSQIEEFTQFENMPYEILLMLISQLDLDTIHRLCSTSVNFYELCESEEFQKDLFNLKHSKYVDKILPTYKEENEYFYRLHKINQKNTTSNTIKYRGKDLRVPQVGQYVKIVDATESTFGGKYQIVKIVKVETSKIYDQLGNVYNKSSKNNTPFWTNKNKKYNS